MRVLLTGITGFVGGALAAAALLLLLTHRARRASMWAVRDRYTS